MHGKAKYFLAAISIFFLSPLLTKNSYALLPIEQKINPEVVQSLAFYCSNNYTGKINSLNTAESKHFETYTKLSDRLEQMIQKWGDWGYDVSKIEDDVSELDEKIQEFEEDFDDLVTKMQAAKSACNTTTYTTKANTAKEALREVRADVVDIRVFYQTVLRKHILELKSQEL